MKVFRMNDCDHWLADSLDHAISSYAEYTGESIDDIKNDEPTELTDDDLESSMMTDIDEDENPLGEITFMEQLQKMKGETEPQLFSTTEW